MDLLAFDPHPRCVSSRLHNRGQYSTISHLPHPGKLAGLGSMNAEEPRHHGHNAVIDRKRSAGRKDVISKLRSGGVSPSAPEQLSVMTFGVPQVKKIRKVTKASSR